MAPSTLVWRFEVHPSYTEMLDRHGQVWADALGAEYAGVWAPTRHRGADRHLIVGGLTRRPELPEGKVTLWYPEQPMRAAESIRGFLARGVRVLVPYHNYAVAGVTFFPSYWHPLLSVTTPAPRRGPDLFFYGWPTERRVGPLHTLKNLLGLRGKRFVWWTGNEGYLKYLAMLGTATAGLCMASWDEPIFYPVRIISELLAAGVVPVVEERCLAGAYEDILPFCRVWRTVDEIPALLDGPGLMMPGDGLFHVMDRYALHDLVRRYPVFD